MGKPTFLGDRERGMSEGGNRPTAFSATQFAIVVCRDESTGKFLAVKKKGKGWWMPGGYVDAKENFFSSAMKHAKRDCGVNIKPQGILRVEYTPTGPSTIRMRLVLLASPADSEGPTPGDNADDAKWVTLEELAKLSETDGLRGPELIGWGTYVKNGGQVYPLQIMAPENAPIPTKKPQ